jgi:hypothetical protein
MSTVVILLRVREEQSCKRAQVACAMFCVESGIIISCASIMHGVVCIYSQDVKGFFLVASQ